MKWIASNLKKFSDGIGGKTIYWFSSSHHIELQKEYNRLFKKYINKQVQVLDLGAGRLFYKKWIQKYTNEYKSIDFQRTHPDLDYIGTTSRTCLADKSFDVVFCSQVLEHVSNPAKSFQEIYRILKKNGIAIISTPFLFYLHNEPHDYFRYTKHAFKKFADDANFEIVELKEIGGLFGFFGSVIQATLIGLFWGIPVIKYFFLCFNIAIQCSLYVLDKLIPTHKIFPSFYLLVIRKT